ncbi:hypothetical protein F4780DRAFT_752266 [Xylariomycetidae sp. FL0641]|nr:hypothetical protein F4780DRAFT_752266 [Xylariomycetidae sp. FL0641]
MASEEPEVGDKVSWNWGGGAPGGKVANKKKEGEIAIKSKKGNTIKKNADPENPAVHIDRSGNDVVKRASELNIEEKRSGNKRGSDDETKSKRKADENSHTTNGNGKEVKKGGKAANKKQKHGQDEDVTQGHSGDTDEGEDKKKSESPKADGHGEKKTGANGRKGGSSSSPKQKSKGRPKKGSPTHQEGDMVSTRTRSQDKKKL